MPISAPPWESTLTASINCIPTLFKNGINEVIDSFRNFNIIRSTELVYIANKKKLIKIKDPKAYEAMLYAVKYKGTSISESEVEQMKRMN